MVNLAVISNEEQYRQWQRLYSAQGKWKIFCDNPDFYAFLRSANVAYEALDEFLLRDEWQAINSWGCDRAAQWARLSKERGYFNWIDWGQCFYYTLSYVLISVLRNYRHAEWLILHHKPEAVLVFESPEVPAFPGIYGNFYLNHFLEACAAREHLRINKIRLKQAPKAQYPASTERLTLKDHVKKIADVAYAFWVRPRKEEVLVRGSLTHLGPVIEKLSERKASVAIYSESFNVRKLRFAMEHRLRFLTRRCFLENIRMDDEKFYRENWGAVSQALEMACRENLFVFHEIDFGSFIREKIFVNSRNYFIQCAGLAGHYERILDICRPKGWLVDEDVSGSGSFLAAFFKAKKVEIFCVSHAHYPVDFKVSEINRVYAQSLTFVNSEYEKEIFCQRGWDGEKLIVTGTPRYDRLVRGRDCAKERKHSDHFDLLLCGSSLWMSRPEYPAYLGCHVTNWGETQIPSCEAILGAIKDKPIRLMVKPHMREDEKDWEYFFKNKDPQRQVVMKKQSEDFFNLLLESDAMVLSYWSTSVVEAAICGKPVLLVDLFWTLQDHAPFVRVGACRIFRDAETLGDAMGKFARQKSFPPKMIQNFEYHFGEQKGRNAQNVADFILNFKKSDHPKRKHFTYDKSAAVSRS